MSDSNADVAHVTGWDRLASRVREWVGIPAVPDYASTPADPQARWHQQVDRARALLEATHASIERDGWTRGAWFSVASPSATGSTGARAIQGAEARTLTGQLHRATTNGCLVGSMLKLAEDPDTAHTHADAWRCVDELYEAMRESAGLSSEPAGWVSSPAERRLRLRALTTWNDAPQRTQAEVTALLDRAVARTIVASCRPR